MKQTKGAIGNLLNRYRAVLKKCHLLNTFGSLAVAGLLVMGGAGVAGAADVVKPDAIISYTGSDFLSNDTLVDSDGTFTIKNQDAESGTISINATGQTTGRGVVTNIYQNTDLGYTSDRVSPVGITITDSVFKDNKDNLSGGAAITLWSDGTEGAQAIEHSIINSTFSGNSAQSFGGAVAIFKQNAFDASSIINISNSIFSKNQFFCIRIRKATDNMLLI